MITENRSYGVIHCKLNDDSMKIVGKTAKYMTAEIYL